MRLQMPELTEKAAAEGRNGHSAAESERRRLKNCSVMTEMPAAG